MKLTKRQKTLAGVLAGLVVIVGGAAAFVKYVEPWSGENPDGVSRGDGSAESRTSEGHDSAPLLPAIRLSRVDSYTRTVLHSGMVRSRSHTMVAFQRAGLLTDLSSDEGQTVSPMQPLATLDSRHLIGQRDSLNAKLEQARSVLAELEKGPRQEAIDMATSAVTDLTEQLKAQQLRLERSAQLLKTNSIARQDHERELYAKRGLEARLKSAQSQLDELKAGTRSEQVEAQQAIVRSIEAELRIVQFNIDDCHLTAPFAGMIVSRFVDPGAVVAAGTPVFELIDDKNLEVHVGVPRTVAEKLRVGNSYKVVVGDQEVIGTLRVVLPMLEQATRTRKAILDVALDPESDIAIFTGQLAQVQLTQEVAEAGFWIPVTALTADHSGLWSCYVVEVAAGNEEIPSARVEGIAQKQSVEILHQLDQQVFVRGTLSDGRLLVSDGMHRIVAGQRIAVQVPGGSVSAERSVNELATDR